MKNLFILLFALFCICNEGLCQKKYVKKQTPTNRTKQISTDKVSTPVDLGLSVMWSAWDLGANKPELLGSQYAWGCTKAQKKWDNQSYIFFNSETRRYTKYYRYSNDDNDLSNHTLRKGKATWTRRSPKEDFGMLDVDKVTVVALDSIDDIAKTKWKNGWRMPTCDELKELNTECEWELTTINGVKGYKVIGPNGNFIFLAGDKDCNGGYWSCEAPVFYEDDAYGLSFNRFNPIYDRHYRYCTMSIRPVMDCKK